MHNTIGISSQQSYQADAREKQPSHSLREGEDPDGDTAQRRAQGGAKPLNMNRRQNHEIIEYYLSGKQSHPPEAWKTYRLPQQSSTSYDDQEDHSHETT